jgi:hypothetical protein
MANEIESTASSSSKPMFALPARPSSWLGIGIVAAASALASGLAVAWWYRKTLYSLHNAGQESQSSTSEVPEENPTDEM